MKTPITLLFLLFCCGAFAQIPSINPTSKSRIALEIPFNKIIAVKDTADITSERYVIPDKDFLQLSLMYKDNLLISYNDSLPYMPGIDKGAAKLVKRSVKGVFDKELRIKDYSFYIDGYNKRIDLMKEEIEEIEDERKKETDMGKVNALTDSINLKKEKIIIAKVFVSELVDKKNDSIGWFPSTRKNYKEDFFQEFYRENTLHTNYFNNISLVFGSTTVQSELLSDYAGPFRFAFGMVVNANSNDNDEAETDPDSRVLEEDESAQDTEDDLKRLINGGGNFYLSTQFPVHAYSSPTFSEMLRLNLNFASDFEGIGNDVETSNFKYGLNVSSYLNLTSDQKKFNFFINADWGFIGGSDDFKDDFGLDDVFNKPAFLGKAILGVSLDNRVTISITTKTISNYEGLRSEKVMVGIQLLN